MVNLLFIHPCGEMCPFAFEPDYLRGTRSTGGATLLLRKVFWSRAVLVVFLIPTATWMPFEKRTQTVLDTRKYSAAI